MGDEFPCKHRSSTTEYRDGWELIWGKKTPEVLGGDVGHVDGDKSNVRDVSVEEIDNMIDRHKDSKNQC